jgi:hypothetical protein
MFFSNNQLHKHLRQDICMKKSSISQLKLEETTIHLTTNIFIVEFTTDSFKNIDIDFEFRDWTYVKIMISFLIKDNEALICLDTDCSVTLTNRDFIKTHEAHYIIRRMSILLNVRELKTNKHEISKYIIAIIYFSEFFSKDEKFMREMIRREVHLMNNLKINMFIENDILDSEEIFINDVNSKIIIASCQEMIISIEIRILTKNIINKILHARFTTMISFHFMTLIFIHHSNLSNDRDFLFESFDSSVSLYAHAIDVVTNCIMIRNDSSQSIKIFRNVRLDRITKIQYLNVFHVDLDIKNYVERKSTQVHKKSWFKRVLKAAMIVYSAVVAISFTFEEEKSANMILSNDVIIHNFTSRTIIAIFDLINQYLDLWKSQEFVKLSKDQWMRISLRFDWKIRIFEKTKIYSLKTKNKKLVDQIFDDLHAKKRLKYTTESTSFSYSVFVVWKMINDQKKNRVVINIRDLNAIILFDAYSLSLQSDVISAVKECEYLSIIDCVSFFYQWRVHSSNRHKLTVISHRDQKIFQIAMMRYKTVHSMFKDKLINCFVN